jgi:dTDP-4-dehydrorhamnose reductase
VGATRNVVDAAAGAHVILVSTDWVFDGTQSGAREDEPPNPINAYGFLKAASELVIEERAQRGAVARISGVQGVHRARPDTPRAQDAGFGYLVASLVDALRAGRRFTVWDAPDINVIATPTVATDAAELIRRMIERKRTGIHHCCGGESISRTELARRAVEAFALDAQLLDVGPAPPTRVPIPYDTSLDCSATAAALGVPAPGIDEQLRRLRACMIADN